MVKIIEELEKYSFVTAYLLFSVFVVSTSSSPIIFSKLIMLTIFASLGVLLWAIKNTLKSSLSFATGKYDISVLLLVVAYIVSALIKTPNKMEAFLIPGSATFVLLSGVFYFLVNQLSKSSKTLVTYAIFGSGFLLSLSLIFTQIGLFAKIPQLPAFIKDVNFNPIGGAVPSLIYLAITLALGIVFIIKDKDFSKRILTIGITGITLIGLIVSINNILPNKAQSPRFPTLKNSWEITIDTLKNSPIWGAGSGNYLTAFNLYRSVNYNQSDLWQVRFTTANNFLLTLITETGFVGLLALIVLIFSVYKNTKNISLQNFEDLLPAITIILFVLIPTSPTLIFTLMAILAINSKSENKKFEIEIPSKIPSVIVGGVFVILAVVFDIYAYKYISAEYYFKSALDSLAKNDAKLTYEFMQKAIEKNPKVDRYHASLAQIDMAIASSLASQKTISDTDRETITQLVQGAIAEGKSTVSLNPQRSGNWEILAQIYRSIMAFAQGSDQFAIQTYTQAVALDPTNPNLRISLGGVYYALGKYDEAIDSFKLAILAKSDLANAHYNLAIAYREKKNFDMAIDEMNAVIGMVNKDSEDYKLAQNILSELQKNKIVKTGESTDELTTPQTLEKSTIKPPIELPSEATPPQQ